MPILKQLVSGSSQAKRRSRMDLTREMISAPLGDFRHTMHVGRSGDAFGDTSFLSTRSGEPPREAQAYPHSPRPGLLSRTFRSSKRSQSVTRVDQHDGPLAPPGGSPTYVKNAMSLPFLNDEDGGRGEGCRVPSSLSSSPLRQSSDQDGRPSNGAAGSRSPELDERSFGELTDLPFMQPYGGGMKKAESVMSFHIDLGPSMLGDILGVMEKEEDDLGYEEGRNSEGRASPAPSTHEEGEDGMEVGEEEEEEVEEDREEEQEEEEVEGKEKEEEVAEEEEEEVEVEAECEQPPERPPSSVDLEQVNGAPYTPEYTPELQPKHPLHLDTCSLSSSGSAAAEDKPAGQAQGGGDAADSAPPDSAPPDSAPPDSAPFSAPPEDESHFSSFMEDEDEEIRL